MADVGLRTAMASLVSAAMLPKIAAAAVRPVDASAEREALRFYADLGAAQDPESSFPAPTEVPRVSSMPANPIAEWMAHGRVHNIKFKSSFEAINPAVREHRRGYARNNVVRAQHWVPRRRSPPDAVRGPRFHGIGLPVRTACSSRCHGSTGRATTSCSTHCRSMESAPRRISPFSGYGYFADGFAGFAEAMAQAVHDFRSVMDYLEHTGVDRIALTGMSLGGYTSALVASVDDRVQAVIPNVPVVDVGGLIDDWFPANRVFQLASRITGTDRELSTAAAMYHSPLNYAPLVPKDRRLIITGLGDRLAPPEQAEKLWEHWDRCALHWFPGNHVLHVSQPDYLRRMTRFTSGFMFS